MKYLVNVVLNGDNKKMIVDVPDGVNRYQVYLLLTGKYGSNITVNTDSITEVCEESFNL